MADSFLSKLFSGIGDMGSSVMDELSLILQGAKDEAYNPNQEFELPKTGSRFRGPGSQADRDAAEAQRSRFGFNVLGAPIRAIDRMSEAHFGSPLFFDRPKPLMSGTDPGVSPGEQAKAETKIMEMAARRAASVEDAKAKEKQAFADFNQSALSKKSGKDTLSFSAIGDNVSGPMTGRGSFSKIKGQDEDSRALDKMVGQGIPKPLAEIVQKLRKATSQPGVEAAKLEASLLPGLKTPEKEDSAILEKVLAAKDPLAAAQIAKLIFRRLGRSEDYINQLFNGAKVEK